MDIYFCIDPVISLLTVSFPIIPRSIRALLHQHIGRLIQVAHASNIVSTASQPLEAQLSL